MSFQFRARPLPLRRLLPVAVLGIGAFALAAMANAASASMLTTLYSFCAKSGCQDGDGAFNGLVEDAAGNLYGTANTGGAHNAGALFAVTPNGAHSSESVLYSFCTLSARADGAQPTGPVSIDESGDIFDLHRRRQ